jgi:hypothetical protein
MCRNGDEDLPLSRNFAGQMLIRKLDGTRDAEAATSTLATVQKS